MREIVYVDLTSYSPKYLGGVSSYTKGLIKGLLNLQENFKIVFLVTDQNQIDSLSIENNGNEIIFVKPTFPKAARVINSFNYRLIKSRKLLSFTQQITWHSAVKIINLNPGVIYTPTTYANFTARKAKLVVSLHDIQEKSYPQFFSSEQKIYRDVNVKNTLNLAWRIQTSSLFVKNEILSHYTVSDSNMKFEIIPEGVEIAKYKSTQRQKTGSNLKMVLLPASFHRHKNQQILLNSIPTLSSKFKFYLTGDVNIHRQKKDFIELSNQGGLVLTGFISDKELNGLYGDADIVLSTSLYESSSLPLLEGIAARCIPVASNIPAHREMTEKLKIFLFDPFDTDGFCNLLDEIYSLSEKERDEILSHNARVLKHYSWYSIAENYADLFNRAFISPEKP